MTEQTTKTLSTPYGLPIDLSLIKPSTDDYRRLFSGDDFGFDESQEAMFLMGADDLEAYNDTLAAFA